MWIKENIRCCSCEKPMKRSAYINMVTLQKEATWKYPAWGNILVAHKYPTNRATAILCDRCIDEKRTPKYAVEWDNGRTRVTYHKVEELCDLPPIPEDEIRRAEAALLDFGVKG